MERYVTNTQKFPQRLGFGRDRFVIGPWQGDPAVAYLSTARMGTQIDPRNLDRCLQTLANSGFDSVVTPALHPEESPVYFAAGFEEFDSLVVLAHMLRDIPKLSRELHPSLRLRRARRRDLETIINLDSRAFPPNWRIGPSGVQEARSATKRNRFRVVEKVGSEPGPRPGATTPSVGRTPVAYAITGRTGSMGFLQRLATDPEWNRLGIGTALVIDALEWVSARGCSRLLVNTQHTNRRALALYESLGFTKTATRLAVLRCSL